MLRALDEAIAKGHWEGGLFFQAAGKKLRDLSEKLKKELNLEDDKQPTAAEMIDYVKQRSGLVETFIAVYCAEGANIKRWESVLTSLPKQVVGRPIYKREKDIKDIIATKENPINDGYIVAYIAEMDILKPTFREKASVDRFGHELIRLKDNTLKLENITKLIHLTGEYAYKNGALTRL
ncbi:MAG TPA: Dot/Icm secretion system protein IcmQ [Gammaproteobacteria bacterium]|nr:Dot/Icm secretion system protein IcmQ [Gammaproteobacteria bacterium]